MKRLGMYTGRIYDGDSIRTLECTVPLTNEEAADEVIVADKYATLHNAWCIDCTYCSLSREQEKE